MNQFNLLIISHLTTVQNPGTNHQQKSNLLSTKGEMIMAELFLNSYPLKPGNF